MNCPFCKIDGSKSRIIRESENVFVMFSNPRLVPGHLLVIPKRHVEKLSELNPEERKELFDTAIEFQDKILAKIASGCDIRQNYRPFIKQSNLKIDHLHLHLIPRELYDELYEKCYKFQTELFQELKTEEVERVSELLKK